jgi:DNA-binding NarL/FixJ family response regulator
LSRHAESRESAIRVALADDHPLIARAIKAVFEEHDDMQLVASCARGDDVIATVERHHPDVLLLDIRLPGKNGLEILSELSRWRHRPRVVFLTAGLSDQELVEATRLGVDGLMLKDLAPELLVQCIRAVHRGERWLERQSVVRAFEHLIRRESFAAELRGVLTARETDLLLQAAAVGVDNAAISRRLHISEGTVKTHLHSIYHKLGLRNRRDLIALVKTKGLI